jgi:nucleoside-diphosphate-sugar epimerase
VHCGTIWVHGPSVEVPTREDAPRRPFGEYGTRKAAIESFLLEQARAGRLPVSILHPGHLVGRGWTPVNPAGNFNPQVFSDLASGREVTIPDLGLTTLNHVHVDDVAQAFVRTVARQEAAVGEAFHVVSSTALTLRGYAERMAEFFGRTPRLRFVPYDEWRLSVSERDAAVTWDHLLHSPHCSIDKARSRLAYEPRYNPLDAVKESIIWLVQQGVVRQDPP